MEEPVLMAWDPTHVIAFQGFMATDASKVKVNCDVIFFNPFDVKCFHLQCLCLTIGLQCTEKGERFPWVLIFLLVT